MPGPGFGGSCFPKDTRALVKIAQDHDVPLRIVEAVLRQRQPQARDGAQGRRARSAAVLRGKTIAVLGLTFKPDTDDMREAPSIPLVTGPARHGREGARARSGRHGAGAARIAGHRILRRSLCLRKGADALVIVTEWVQFRALDLERLKRDMAQPVVVDLRNIYRPEDMAALGFTYESVGRGRVPTGAEAARHSVMAVLVRASTSCLLWIMRRGCSALRQVRSCAKHGARA